MDGLIDWLMDGWIDRLLSYWSGLSSRRHLGRARQVTHLTPLTVMHVPLIYHRSGLSFRRHLGRARQVSYALCDSHSTHLYASITHSPTHINPFYPFRYCISPLPFSSTLGPVASTSTHIYPHSHRTSPPSILHFSHPLLLHIGPVASTSIVWSS